MKRLLAPIAFLTAFLLVEAAPPAKWTEHRRALLVNASNDQAHAVKIKQLEKALQAKGFVAQIIGDAPKTDGVTYEKWVRSIPTMGVSVFYYLGHLETEKSPDGKHVCYSMQLGGYKALPPARDEGAHEEVLQQAGGHGSGQARDEAHALLGSPGDPA